MISITDKTKSTSRTSGIGAFRPWTRAAIFAPVLIWAGGTIDAAEVNKPAPKPAEAPAMTAVQTSPDDLQNLVACARLQLPNLTADQIAAVAVAIKHAEEDIAAMRKAAAAMPPPPAEAKK